MNLLASILNPSTHAGTARWVALGVVTYDACTHGMNWINTLALLALGAGPVAVQAMISRNTPPAPPTATA